MVHGKESRVPKKVHNPNAHTKKVTEVVEKRGYHSQSRSEDTECINLPWREDQRPNGRRPPHPVRTREIRGGQENQIFFPYATPTCQELQGSRRSDENSDYTEF